MSSMPLIKKPVFVDAAINRNVVNEKSINHNGNQLKSNNLKDSLVHRETKQSKTKQRPVQQNRASQSKAVQSRAVQSEARQINADFSVPVIIESKLFDWPTSSTMSMAGVQQHCFEHMAKDKTRLTSLLKFSAGRSFKKFGHESGEEFLVLSGVFSDADGDYGAGYYVRNPPGTTHEPYTRDGCIVLFKLGQFQALDSKRVRVNTVDSVARWRAAGEPGVSCMDLHQFSEEQVNLYRIRSECWITFKPSHRGLEIFVCEGFITIKNKCYATGCWLRYPAGSKIKVSSMGGACLYVKHSVFVN